jgi:hypothetical protein
MSLTPSTVKLYHVFLASPGDVNQERQSVRQFFERYNRTIAQLWSVRFEVIDWENYGTVGIGRPQELITKQTLARFKDSLALVIGVMAQRFGSPTGQAESGTEEEFRWAIAFHKENGFPEIKWFFKRIERFVAPPDPDGIAEAAAQWGRVSAFREELKAIPMYCAEYPDTNSFKEVFDNDLSRWLSDRARPWVASVPQHQNQSLAAAAVPDAYYETLERNFHRLDIAGIDNDRAFEIPLSEIYVRLRVMFDEDLQNDQRDVPDDEAIDIQTALLRYSKLAIVGDPGSGKSTFLKFVALMLARAVLQNNPALALEKLCLQEPLPIPVFISCWDLSDFLREEGKSNLPVMLTFVAERVSQQGFQLEASDLEVLLREGQCCLLFDGLDEVPTDAGRAVVSRLLEDCVKTFPKNRYVVTSRVRAYTGDAILKGEFARCDIQPFDAEDRSQFLKNWVALLFKTATVLVLTDGTEANREFQSLTKGIETNDRIRPLAVNPLLLTVIAIVHWNRKRLPEQRVDLYDECVDVLLGQRKEAEHIQSYRKAEAFDEQLERYQEEERPWIRKRFAEIALRILDSEENRDEASKSEVVKLLAPRFLDRGAKAQEEAEIQAARFLDKQELSSGLLVSRREHSYRFVHLTFQEYLAAWHLSNQEFDQVASVLEVRLRQQRWFEPMQLLGGEWAKQSDEKLDRYLQWLLDRQGESIIERAPVVALCANIVKDSSGVAEFRPETRKRFQSSVEDTLDAFRPRSGVPVLTQLEILEALGQLGAAVKSHLIDATKSGLNQVRSRAIEILLPHLSDDELFEMSHLLKDRSKEPIKAYLRCLLGRDARRTAHWLGNQEYFSERATEGFAETLLDFSQKLTNDLLKQAIRAVFEKGHSYYGGEWASRNRLLDALADDGLLLDSITNDHETAVRAQSLKSIVVRKAEFPQTWELVRKSAAEDGSGYVRSEALELLTLSENDNTTAWDVVRDYAVHDRDGLVRTKALKLLAANQKGDPQTWHLIRESLTDDEDDGVRREALELLAAGKPNDESTLQLIAQAAFADDDIYVRKTAFVTILKHSSLKDEAQYIFSHLPWWAIKFDPREDQITHERVETRASELKLHKGEIRRRAEVLADKLHREFGLTLKLEWREHP